MWQPQAKLDDLRELASYIQQIREFFYKRSYLEVFTPVLNKYPVSDVFIENISATANNNIAQLYLRTSPEYHMKRLLCAQSGAIFQLGSAFRDDEVGAWHNNEFLMLEWYKLNCDHYELINEVEELFGTVFACKKFTRMSYKELFEKFAQIDPFSATVMQLASLLEKHGINHTLESSAKDPYLFLILSQIIEPKLKLLEQPLAIYDYPSSQAALAKVSGTCAQRFEIYWRGIELANGFHELQNYKLQKKRFENDNLARTKLGLKNKELDEDFLEALSFGMPHCSGVALGIERTIAVALRLQSLHEIQAFKI